MHGVLLCFWPKTQQDARGDVGTFLVLTRDLKKGENRKLGENWDEGRKEEGLKKDGQTFDFLYLSYQT